ncbi:MAG: hypothetical protein WA672_13700 [Candidatus Angelobacter sp.]
MKVSADPGYYHKLYGTKQSKPRITYYKKDFIDYVLMIGITALVLGLCYGSTHPLAIIGYALCAFEIAAFVVRHGVEWQVPLIIRDAQELIYVWGYKLRNLRPIYFLALGLLLLENVVIRLTPSLPHHTEWVRTGALWLFYINLIYITVYRTISLIDHLRKKEMVREILMQTPWQRAITKDTNMTLEILHAYVTGVLSHVVLFGAWYLVIRYANFSLLLLLPVCIINAIVHRTWLRVANSWFYRNHWLGHHSELQFVYLHGNHHDAIPSGMIAVSENGYLEGFFRHMIGWPHPFFHPLAAFWYYTREIKFDIEMHQYIPGVFPKMSDGGIDSFQHSTHHYGPLEPYGFAFRLGTVEETKAYGWVPDEMRNAIRLDEQMGFKWDNPTFRRTKMLYDKYHNPNGEKSKAAHAGSTENSEHTEETEHSAHTERIQ